MRTMTRTGASSPASAESEHHLKSSGPDASQKSESPLWFDWLANGFSLVVLAFLVLTAWLIPLHFDTWTPWDASRYGSGLFENLTIVVLVVPIVFGFGAFYQSRGCLPHPILSYWILAWSLACFYFLGEEGSWGQTYFHWSTPSFISTVNRQHETNLHNMTSWLNQKPRALVELFIIVAGFIIPAWRLLGRRRKIFRNDFLSRCEGWIYAPNALLAVGLLYVVTRIATELPQPLLQRMGQGELRELVIAWFLAWYLVSYFVRLKRLPKRSSLVIGTR